MVNRLGNLYALLFGWPALAKLHRALFYLSGRALGLHNYASPGISGETRAIRLGLVGKRSPVVFDVGANKGDWTGAVLELSPSAVVHAFEPQEALARQIALRHPASAVNNMALADAPGFLQLFDYAEHAGSEHASLLAGVIDGIHRGKVDQVTVRVDTLDAYCLAHSIGRIDVLKIDVEGFELKVLEGAQRMLAERRIEMIQFEFNEMNVVGKTYLNDFFHCLQASHELHRLLPHGLMRLRPGAHWANEQFTFQNIVALRKRQET